MAKLGPHSEILKRYYDRWHDSKGGSADEWMEVLADNVDFRSLAMGRETGADFTVPRVSKGEVKGYFEGLASQWTMIHYTVDQFIEQDGRVCAIGSTAWTNNNTGKTVETPKVDVWRFEDGKAVAFFEYYDTAAMFACACD